MKNITVFAVLVIILFCAQPALSQGWNDSFAFSVAPVFGFFYGQAEEIVYPPSGYIAPYLSQLLYNMKTVFYYGLLMDFSKIEAADKWNLFASLSLKLGIPGESGFHENFDWQSVQNDALTNYSWHYNTTKELFLLDFTAGVSFPLRYGLHISALAGVSYKRFSFYGMGGGTEYARELPPQGSGIYAPITDNPETSSIPPDKKVINYSQDWMVFSPGVLLKYYFLKAFSAEISFMISPFIICADLDEHLVRKIQFRDYTRGGLYLEPGARIAYAAGKWVELSLEYSWQYITGTRGGTYSKSYGRGYYLQGGEAGTGLWLMDTGLYVKIRL